MSQANGFAYAAPVTPHDTNPQPPYDSLQVCSIAGGATAVITPSQGADITYTGLTVGVVIPVKVKLVKSTGTLASFVGLMRG